MSKIIDAVRAHRTGQLHAKLAGPISYLEMTEINDSSLNPIPHLVEYRIDVSVGARVRWEEGKGLGDVTRHVSKIIEQEIFGEFRGDFDRIHLALYESDYEAIRKAVEDMQKRMFSA